MATGSTRGCLSACPGWGRRLAQVDRQLTGFGIPLSINAEFWGSCLVVPALEALQIEPQGFSWLAAPSAIA